jgi:hypothetical protein
MPPMTEEKWLTTTGTAGMFRVPQVASDARKLRLFGVACCRQVPEWSEDARVAAALAAAEEFADGKLARAKLAKHHTAVAARYNKLIFTRTPRADRSDRLEATFLWACLHALTPDDALAVRHTADILTSPKDGFGAALTSGWRNRRFGGVSHDSSSPRTPPATRISRRPVDVFRL